MVSVLLSASVERVGVSRMRDFLFYIFPGSFLLLSRVITALLQGWKLYGAVSIMSISVITLPNIIMPRSPSIDYP